ncbi:MAG: zinc ribbon domain-containing protein [Oscillospiraceae bacterium]|nr:zinc ribbon domain-containing protein [Oscillospiraceae bacterium]
MAFFDGIADKAKKYAAVAAEKAKDVAELAADKAKDVKETAQTRMAIKAEEREMEKNYCAIGQWFCAEYTGEMPDAVKDVVAAIEAGRAKIAELEASLVEDEITVEFVSEEAAPVVEPEAVPELKACPACGTPSNSRFCPECGAAMGE